MEIVIQYIALTANVCICIGVVVAVWSIKADHWRRKRQSTIEFYNSISAQTYSIREKIREVFGNDVITPTDNRYKSDKELQREINLFLALLEQYSVGVNVKMYDLKIFMRIAGRSTIRWYERLNPIIKHKRELRDHVTAYGDFERLVKTMEKKYKIKK